MSIESDLIERSESKCELCAGTEGLEVYAVPPVGEVFVRNCIYLCGTCKPQIEGEVESDTSHWHCLSTSMWSEIPVVQVTAFRMLNRLQAEGWPLDLIDQMYMDEETKVWANIGLEREGGDPKHVDSNGNELKSGDTVTLTKSLDVKGSSLTAKRGTSVRNISLVLDDHKHIEGRVDGQKIVILTKFVKKS